MKTYVQVPLIHGKVLMPQSK